MNPAKQTYAEVLKTPRVSKDPKLTAQPLIPTPIRARLTKEAKANLRAAIKGEETMMASEPNYKPVIFTGEPVSQPLVAKTSQPLMLATASDFAECI